MTLLTQEVIDALNSLADQLGYEDERLVVLRDVLDPLPLDEDDGVLFAGTVGSFLDEIGA